MQQKWLFCLSCYRDQIFEYVYKDHGLFSGGHTEWHCITCGGCSYEPSRSSH